MSGQRLRVEDFKDAPCKQTTCVRHQAAASTRGSASVSTVLRVQDADGEGWQHEPWIHLEVDRVSWPGWGGVVCELAAAATAAAARQRLTVRRGGHDTSAAPVLLLKARLLSLVAL